MAGRMTTRWSLTRSPSKDLPRAEPLAWICEALKAHGGELAAQNQAERLTPNWRTDKEPHRRSVVFGGIDTKKYKGKLVKRPIIPAAQSPDGQTRYWVYLDGISVNQPDGKVVEVYKTPAGGKGQPVLLDSGYTLSALPSPIFDKLVAAFPSAVYYPSSEMYAVNCADPGKGGSLDFTFGDTVINARYYDFVWHLDGETCVLGAFRDDSECVAQRLACGWMLTRR